MKTFWYVINSLCDVMKTMYGTTLPHECIRMMFGGKQTLSTFFGYVDQKTAAKRGNDEDGKFEETIRSPQQTCDPNRNF